MTAKRPETISNMEDPPNATLVEPLLPPHQSSQNQDSGDGDGDEAEPAVVLTSDPSLINNGDYEQVPLDLHTLTFDESAWDHGESQAPAYRNPFWAVLFLGQFVVMTTLAVMATVDLSKGDYYHEHIRVNVNRTLLFFVATVFGSTLLSAVLILLLLTALSDMMIQVSLVISPIASGLASLGALLAGQIGVAIMLAVFCGLGVWYAVGVWHRIPFATANLAIAMAAIHVHKGLFSLAYGTTIQAVLWSLIWFLATAEVYIVHREWIMTCEPVPSGEADDPADDGDFECHLTTGGKWIVVALLFSLYWTSQVIKNVLHTTIAGVVGTFWFSPPTETSNGNTTNGGRGGCCGCNSTIYDAWVRSSVYSFGSICLGSLLVAVLQVLQVLVRIARQQREEQNRERGRSQGSLLFCFLEFIVDQLERVMEYINAWAFVYVGLYGYEYWAAGSKVYQLFRARGWSVILNDHLISRSLGLMQVFIGILSGALAVVLGLIFLGMTVSPLATFSLGVLLGMMLSNIQLQVVTSAVSTVVVCFAEAPSALVENHPPELSGRMIQAWRMAYPDECGF